jgi:hypothetical protein
VSIQILTKQSDHASPNSVILTALDNILDNILVFNKEILINSTFIIYNNSILYRNNLKVFILVFLYKNNSSNIYINNIFIKLEIIIRNKVFIFFS